MLDGLSLVDLAVFERTEHGIQLVELHLTQVEIVQEIVRKRPQLVGGLDQPLQHCIRVDLEHPRRASDAQALGQAADDVYDEVDRDAFAMKDGAMGFEKVAPAAAAIQLSPRATARMTVRTDIASPKPAAIGTVGIRAEMVRGVDVTAASSCR